MEGAMIHSSSQSQTSAAALRVRWEAALEAAHALWVRYESMGDAWSEARLATHRQRLLQRANAASRRQRALLSRLVAAEEREARR